MVVIRPLTVEDKEAIKRWPPYSGVFAQMDYALRKGGWLDDFFGRAHVLLFAAESGGQLAGFSLLALLGNAEAEFRIALHPDWTGKGVGKKVALATLAAGFGQYGLKRIHLIVRRSNPVAMRLYHSIGFTICGESSHEIQGSLISFCDMEIFANRWCRCGEKGQA